MSLAGMMKVLSKELERTTFNKEGYRLFLTGITLLPIGAKKTNSYPQMNLLPLSGVFLRLEVPLCNSACEN